MASSILLRSRDGRVVVGAEARRLAVVAAMACGYQDDYEGERHLAGDALHDASRWLVAPGP